MLQMRSGSRAWSPMGLLHLVEAEAAIGGADGAIFACGHARLRYGVTGSVAALCWLQPACATAAIMLAMRLQPCQR